MIPDVLFFQEGPGVRNSQYKTEGIKLLNVANLQNGEIDLSTSERYISKEEAYGRYNHFLVDEGDLIIASSGIKVDYFDKKMGFVRKEHLPLCMNTSTIRFKTLDKNKMNLNFFMYYLKTEYFKSQLAKLITGSAQLNFGPSHLKQISVPVPPIEEQMKIAEILDKASNFISLRKKQIEKLDLLVKARFIEMFGNPVFNSKGWKIKDIDSVSELIVDCPHSTPKYSSESTGYMCIRTTILKPNYINWNEVEYISESEYNYRTKRYVPKEGDIVYSREGAILGIASLIDRKGHIALGQRIMLISVSDLIINSRFLCFSMNSEGVLEQVKNLIGGSASPHINVSDVKRIKIPLPPIDLQNQFADFVQQVEKQKAQLQQGLEKLELTYKALMQQYFN